jgi:hypothetical protein
VAVFTWMAARMLACRALGPVTTQRSTPLSPTRRTGADASEIRGRSRIKNLQASVGRPNETENDQVNGHQMSSSVPGTIRVA